MKPPEKFEKIIDRKKYSVATAELLAGNDHWDGSNFERSGRNAFLYRTPKGAYFYVALTRWQGETDTLNPLTKDHAISLFEEMSEKRVTFQDAFPGVEVTDA